MDLSIEGRITVYVMHCKRTVENLRIDKTLAAAPPKKGFQFGLNRPGHLNYTEPGSYNFVHA